MEGTVQFRGSSKTGKPTITIDGQLYYAGRTDLAGLTPGDRISFTATAFGEKGNLWGIDKGWKLLQAAQKYPSPTGGQNAAPGPSSSPQGGITEGERLTISNWVAHAIGARAIKEPEQIEKWVAASKNAIRSQNE